MGTFFFNFILHLFVLIQFKYNSKLKKKNVLILSRKKYPFGSYFINRFQFSLIQYIGQQLILVAGILYVYISLSK